SGVVTTSSPGPTPAASSERWSAAVQELTAIAYGAPTYSANTVSKARTLGPVESHPDRSVAITSVISDSPIAGGANLTSLLVVLMRSVPRPDVAARTGRSGCDGRA